MKLLTSSEVKNILVKKTFDDLIGAVETDTFEFKRGPYNINNKSQKRELAKDISSLANANGGILIIGLERDVIATSSLDTVKSLCPFSSEKINLLAYRDICNEWIYPKITNLNISFETYNVKDGFLIFEVPAQPKEIKPFLITKTPEEDKTTSNVFFGYSVRTADSSIPFTIQDIYSLIKKGLNYENNIEDKLASFENKLDSIASRGDTNTVPSNIPNAEIVNDYIDSLRSSLKLRASRTVSIAFIPQFQGKLKTIFSTSKESIYTTIYNSKGYRQAGWSIENMGEPEIISGRLIRSLREKRVGIDLYETGAMIATSSLERNWLSHASPDNVNRINSLALIEMITSICDLYGKVIEDFDQLGKTFKIYIKLQGLFYADDKLGTSLGPYAIDSHAQAWGDGLKEARNDEDEIEIDISTQELYSVEKGYFNSRRVAYKIVEKVYLSFGIEIEKIPYTKEVEGYKEIDIDTAIKPK